jgi:hypothetical protein
MSSLKLTPVAPQPLSFGGASVQQVKDYLIEKGILVSGEEIRI